MRIILDVDDDVFEEMKLLAEVKDISVNEMLTDLYIKYLDEPQKYIFNEMDNDNKAIDMFERRLYTYLNEMIKDIAADPKTPIVFDDSMIPVIKAIRDELLKHPFVIVELYKAYKKSKNLII